MMKKLSLIFLSFLVPVAVFCQKKNLPILKSEKNRLSLTIDSVNYGEAVELNPALKPDIFNLPVKKPMKIQFKSSTDSLNLILHGGQKIDFLVVFSSGKDTAHIQLVGQTFTNPAKFSRAYKKANNLKTSIEIPVVYELTNIVIALTKSASVNRNLTFRNSAYYKKVIDRFSPYKDEKIVKQVDSLIRHNKYAHVKMDGYSFYFKKGKIVDSKIYDRVSWGAVNTLRPFKEDLQQFADKSRFIDFYKENQNIFDDQIRCFQDSIKLQQMVDWLRRNYPSTDYNTFKIIFSPLVAGNQSANSFSYKGFKEAQAHVNYPYVQNYQNKELSSEALILSRGSIVFTELNHSFNDPETEKHVKSPNFITAFRSLEPWLEKSKPAANYNNSVSCFNEYMNWGLVSLYYFDFAPDADREKLIDMVERDMKDYRGFKKFPEFNQFLVSLYKERGGKTIADCYPEIMEWFATVGNTQLN